MPRDALFCLESRGDGEARRSESQRNEARQREAEEARRRVVARHVLDHVHVPHCGNAVRVRVHRDQVVPCAKAVTLD